MAVATEPTTGCTVEILEEKCGLPPETGARYGWENLPGGKVVMDYGPGKRKRIRSALTGDHRFTWEPGPEPVEVYDVGLEDVRGDGQLIVVEGETDAVCGWANGFPCLGLPGASTASKLLPAHVRDIGEIFVCKEPDEGGQTFTSGILKRLAEIGFRGRAWVLTMKETFGLKDLADLHKADPAQFPQKLQRAIDDLRQRTPDFPAAAVESEPDAAKEPESAAEKPKEPESYSWISGLSFLKMYLPKPELIVDPILPTQGLCLLHGPAGCGKTFFCLALAWMIVTGSCFLKYRALKPRPAIYFDGEMSGAVMQRRLAETVKAFDSEPPGEDYFRLFTPDLQAHGVPDLSTVAGQKAVDPLLEGVDVVFLDNLSCLCRTGDENAAESWAIVQSWALDLRKRGKGVVFVHHDGKEARAGGRGTVRRLDVIDTCIALRRPNDYDQFEGLRMEVVYEKSRGFSGDQAKGFEATMQIDQGIARWSWNDLEAELRDQVLDLHRQGWTQRQIGKDLNINKNRVSQILRSMGIYGRQNP